MTSTINERLLELSRQRKQIDEKIAELQEQERKNTECLQVAPEVCGWIVAENNPCQQYSIGEWSLVGPVFETREAAEKHLTSGILPACTYYRHLLPIFQNYAQWKNNDYEIHYQQRALYTKIMCNQARF